MAPRDPRTPGGDKRRRKRDARQGARRDTRQDARAEAREDAREHQRDGERRDDPKNAKGAARGERQSFSDALLGLSKACAEGVSPAVTEAVTQAMVMVLGAGPSVAALEGMFAAETATAAMYHNAVACQHRTNLLGMAMTAKCVRYMMDGKAEDGLADGLFAEEAAHG